MPKVTLRKVVKSELPFKFDGDSDDDYFENKGDDDGHESSIVDRPQEANHYLVNNYDDEEVPVMLEVQVSPTNPID